MTVTVKGACVEGLCVHGVDSQGRTDCLDRDTRTSSFTVVTVMYESGSGIAVVAGTKRSCQVMMERDLNFTLSTCDRDGCLDSRQTWNMMGAHVSLAPDVQGSKPGHVKVMTCTRS